MFMKGKFRKFFIAACIISPLVFFGVVVVLADVWSGPANRMTAGTCTIHHYHLGSLVCSEPCGEPEYHICDASCASAGGCDSSTTDNNPGHSLPDATVSGSTSCSSPGDNGWCKGVGTLHLSGTEPVSGYHITGFDSTLYGPLCSGTSCDWNFPQGITTNLGYWADSTFGDQSDEAFASMSVDSVEPTLTLTIPSPNGSNDWDKTGPVTATASATDATSGVAGVDINGGGVSFSASSDGVYALTASATDKAGNTSTASGTIKLDTTPPDLSVSPAAPDGENGWYVSPALITATDSDATSGIAGTQYQVDGGAWQNGASFSEGTDGTHTLIFRVTDVAGNTTSAAPVTVLVDRTAPIPDASLAPGSPNGANGWYVSPVTITANSSDATSDVASQGVSLDGSTWTPFLTISSDGTYTVQVQAQDKAGNSASATKSIKLDATPPTASFQILAPDGSNGWYVSPVNITVTGTDATSGVATEDVSQDGTTWVSSLTFSADGVYSVRGRVTDNAGNTTTTSPVTVSVDRTAPILGMTLSPAAPNGTNSWYVSPVTVSADSSDATSGIASQAVSLDGKTWEPSLTVSTDGTYTLQVSAQDKAGNTASASQTIHLDGTPPAASFVLPKANGDNGWYVSPVTISAVGTDATSGVASQQVSLDGSSWASSLDLSNDGVYTVHGRVLDNAGNTTTITRTVSIDHTPPVAGTPVLTGTLGLEGWYTSSVGVAVPATDDTSGVASIQYSVDGGAWQTTAPTLTDGVHIVQIKVTDKAGNVSSTSASASVDATLPVSAFISPAEGSTVNVSGNQLVHLTGSTSDATSGVAGAQISLDDGATWQSLPLGAGDAWSYDWNSLRNNGTYTFQVRGTDNAGNLEHPAKVTIVVGNQPPRVSITPIWIDFGSASVSINPGSLPIAGASITVKDPKGRWPDAVFSYFGSALPTKFVWLGRMGNGSIATIGRYQVTVKAWDTFGNTGSASGWVLIPLPPPQPTATPASPAAPQPATPAVSTSVRTIIGIPAATPTSAPKQVVPTPAPTPAPAAHAKKPTATPWWPASFTGSLFVLFLSLSMLDPRPAALRHLARSKIQEP
jgi:hypothetical protein